MALNVVHSMYLHKLKLDCWTTNTQISKKRILQVMDEHIAHFDFLLQYSTYSHCPINMNRVFFYD